LTPITIAYGKGAGSVSWLLLQQVHAKLNANLKKKKQEESRSQAPPARSFGKFV